MVAIALGLGFGLSWYALTDGRYFGAAQIGPWAAWPRAGLPSPDPYTRAYLARTGAFPVSAWRDDLREHNVRWVVLGFDPRHPAGYASDGYLSAYRNELREVLDQRFVFDGQMGYGQPVLNVINPSVEQTMSVVGATDPVPAIAESGK